MSLDAYKKKRNFRHTPEPGGAQARQRKTAKPKEPVLHFVVQEHHASHLHFDLRLEMGGVLKSWAVPKGPSLDPDVKRLAIMTEDHPLKYLDFAGHIPEGNYGAGDMAIWDSGTYTTMDGARPERSVHQGQIHLWFEGNTLRGGFNLFRLKKADDDEHDQWLLVKKDDEAAQKKWQLTPLLAPGETLKTSPKAARAGAGGKTPHRAAAKATKSSAKTAAAATAAEAPTAEAPAAEAPAAEVPPAAQLAGATDSAAKAGRRAAMPLPLKPMLATLAAELPAGDDWLYEVKWDGYRILCVLEKGKVRLISRNGNDLTATFAELAEQATALPAQSAILDGELVALDDAGRPGFQLLQNYAGIRGGRQKLAAEHAHSDKKASPPTLAYYAFDLPYLNGRDLRAEPLLARKQWLEALLAQEEARQKYPALRYSRHYLGAEKGAALLQQMRREKLEGVIAKDPQSPYLSRRSGRWLKIKLGHSVDAVIAGYTAARGSRAHFGSLILGLFDGDALRFAGHVGTGFDQSSLQSLFALMQPLRSDKCPLIEQPPVNAQPTWLKPQLVCEVRYGEATADHHLRHPVFVGVRSDKDARECQWRDQFEVAAPEDAATKEKPVKEKPMKAASKSSVAAKPLPAAKPRAARAKRSAEGSAEAGATGAEALLAPSLSGALQLEIEGHSVQLTHLDKIYWKEAGFTKGDLLRYTYRMAPLLLPYLRDRPLILQRYPNGLEGVPFFQHDIEDAPPFLELFPNREKEKTVHYAVCNNLASLLYLANLGAIAHNPWHSRTDMPARPDWFVFDLDPDDAPYSALCELALALRDLLRKLGLTCYAKTSGATGLHVYLPIERRYSYDQVLDFGTLIAHTVMDQHPGLATLERSIKKRPRGAVYFDVGQNYQGKTVAGPWSVRAQKAASVSTPLSWAQVKAVPDPADFTLQTVPAQAARRDKWFRGVLEAPQRLESAIAALGKLLQ